MISDVHQLYSSTLSKTETMSQIPTVEFAKVLRLFLNFVVVSNAQIHLLLVLDFLGQNFK